MGLARLAPRPRPLAISAFQTRALGTCPNTMAPGLLYLASRAFGRSTCLNKEGVLPSNVRIVPNSSTASEMTWWGTPPRITPMRIAEGVLAVFRLAAVSGIV